ncbi:MAG: GNAT family N-acetyltransferase [Brevundimonas sp.]|uniref:GNAT family N-acetyltransferase n=1 Tax=Brevundimonas sp. TaxID=1871086 RepID=UPI0028D4C812|nr:GNAT family N-acetyltransferase [uncultured Brevundimonas sp.]
MGQFRDAAGENRFEQTFDDDKGAGLVWADYAVRGDARMILHVEAERSLRGTGAAGRFMQAMAEHAREAGLKLFPQCSYAVAWHKRHPDYDDVLA